MEGRDVVTDRKCIESEGEIGHERRVDIVRKVVGKDRETGTVVLIVDIVKQNS